MGLSKVPGSFDVLTSLSDQRSDRGRALVPHPIGHRQILARPVLVVPIDVPDAVAIKLDLKLLELKAQLVPLDRPLQVADRGQSSPDGPVHDLPDPLPLRSRDVVVLPAEVGVDAVLDHRRPEVGLGSVAARHHDRARLAAAHVREDRNVALHDDVLPVLMVGEHLLEPVQLLAGDAPLDLAILKVEGVDVDEQGVAPRKGVGQPPLRLGPVLRHPKDFPEGLLEGRDDARIDGIVSALVVAGDDVERKVVVLHSVHPAPPVGERVLPGLPQRVFPARIHQVPGHEPKLGAVRLHSLEKPGDCLLIPGLRIRDVPVEEVREAAKAELRRGGTRHRPEAGGQGQKAYARLLEESTPTGARGRRRRAARRSGERAVLPRQRRGVGGGHCSRCWL